MTPTAKSLVLAVVLAALPAGHRTVTISAQAVAPQPEISRVVLTAGRSTVLATDFDIVRIAITNPAIADAVVVSPREVLVDGKTVGTISLIIWGDGQRRQYDLVVDPAVTTLQQQLRALFPNENILVTNNDEATTLSGNVSSTEIMLKAGEIAAKTSTKANIINLLQVPGDAGTQQVLLQVRFAEVNRQAVQEAGVALFTGPNGYKDWVGRSTTGQFAAPVYDEDKITFSDFLNLFVFNTKYNVGALIKALQSKGLLQSLAEPNLMAYNGREASFLAGGEVPVPVVQGGNNAAVTVVYKEFGIRLKFTPTIAGDTIRLKVAPEVSALDFANGVTLSGFRIPALTTRRADTEVELRDGQSFAIAGLLNNISQTDRAAIPVLGSLPIIGNLFKSKSVRQQKTELMVLITPRLVRPLNPDEVPELPTDASQFLADDPVGVQGDKGSLDAPPAATPSRPPR